MCDFKWRFSLSINNGSLLWFLDVYRDIFLYPWIIFTVYTMHIQEWEIFICFSEHSLPIEPFSSFWRQFSRYRWRRMKGEAAASPYERRFPWPNWDSLSSILDLLWKFFGLFWRFLLILERFAFFGEICLFWQIFCLFWQIFCLF